MLRSLFALVLVCSIAGCGARNQSVSDQAPASVDLSSLPVTLEGRLIADVGEGDVDSEGEESEYSEFNFGTLTVGADEIPVQVSGSVLKSANCPEPTRKCVPPLAENLTRLAPRTTTSRKLSACET